MDSLFYDIPQNAVINLVHCKYRKDLIHEDIERAVDHMQSVIELGRVVRDRKTLPIKVGDFHLIPLLKNLVYNLFAVSGAVNSW